MHTHTNTHTHTHCCGGNEKKIVLLPYRGGLQKEMAKPERPVHDEKKEAEDCQWTGSLSDQKVEVRGYHGLPSPAHC